MSDPLITNVMVAKAVKAYESARANGASSTEAMRASLMVAAAASPERGLREAAQRLVWMMDDSPETSAFIARRYDGLDHALDLVRRNLILAEEES